jgi:hypothetical protein
MMSEQDQYETKRPNEPIPVPPPGPHSASTLNVSLSQRALEAYHAMIRKDLGRQSAP